jgi:hypothetical protein
LHCWVGSVWSGNTPSQQCKCSKEGKREHLMCTHDEPVSQRRPLTGDSVHFHTPHSLSIYKWGNWQPGTGKWQAKATQQILRLAQNLLPQARAHLAQGSTKHSFTVLRVSGHSIYFGKLFPLVPSTGLCGHPALAQLTAWGNGRQGWREEFCILPTRHDRLPGERLRGEMV